MKNKYSVITLDGPAGSGKSSLAKLLSEEIGFFQVDSGALYRSYTYIALNFSGFTFEKLASNKISLKDILKDQFFWAFVEEHPLKIEFKEGKQVINWQGKDIDEQIRTPQITSQIKDIADNHEVRLRINQQLQLIGKKYDIIADGRDMGTIVFPKASLKIFITASVETRAKRRLNEFLQKDPSLTLKEVIEQIKKRDFEDENREFGALKTARDSIILDTTDLSLNVALSEIINLIKDKKIC